MFGIGGEEDKEKLKQNMEEIKGLIEGKDEVREEDEEFDPDRGEGFESLSGKDLPENQEVGAQDADEGEGPDNKTRSFDQPQDIDENFQEDQPDEKGFHESQSDEKSFEEKFSGPPKEDRSGTDQGFESSSEGQSGMAQGFETPVEEQQEEPVSNEEQPSRPGEDVREEAEPSEQVRETEQSGAEASELNEKIPEPPETKKLDVPEIDKGPLFIKRQKFESAQRMIQEMKQISREIDQVVNRLQKGIEEDRKTARDAKELLHGLEEDRIGVKHIVSPDED